MVFVFENMSTEDVGARTEPCYDPLQAYTVTTGGRMFLNLLEQESCQDGELSCAGNCTSRIWNIETMERNWRIERLQIAKDSDSAFLD